MFAYSFRLPVEDSTVENLQISYACSAVLVLLLLVSVTLAWRSHRLGNLVVPVCLLVGLAAHPAWTVEVAPRDFGRSKVGLSVTVTVGAFYLLALQYYFHLARKYGGSHPAPPTGL
jgi:hypothetical protein